MTSTTQSLASSMTMHPIEQIACNKAYICIYTQLTTRQGTERDRESGNALQMGFIVYYKWTWFRTDNELAVNRIQLRFTFWICINSRMVLLMKRLTALDCDCTNVDGVMLSQFPIICGWMVIILWSKGVRWAVFSPPIFCGWQTAGYNIKKHLLLHI